MNKYRNSPIICIIARRRCPSIILHNELNMIRGGRPQPIQYVGRLCGKGWMYLTYTASFAMIAQPTDNNVHMHDTWLHFDVRSRLYLCQFSLAWREHSWKLFNFFLNVINSIFKSQIFPQKLNWEGWIILLSWGDPPPLISILLIFWIFSKNVFLFIFYTFLSMCVNFQGNLIFFSEK